MTKPVISRPPRSVPLSTRLAILFGGALGGSVGWPFLMLGTFGASHVLKPEMVEDLIMTVAPTEVAKGEVLGSAPTNASANNEPIYRIRFEFTPKEGRPLQSAGYVVSGPPPSGTPLEVEYLAWDPKVARPTRGTRSLMGMWSLLVLLFPAIGASIVVPAFLRGLRNVRLLVEGEVAKARRSARRPLNMYVNRKQVFEYEFTFEDRQGKLHRTKHKSLRVPELEDDELELVIYDPWKPDRACIVDSLPGGAKIDRFGQVESVGLKGFLYAVPAVLFAAELLWILQR